ncbi:MAG: adenine phosphoribosyltransferase [Elusimicrobiota bacterium]|jgi:adenine phosphoribosyltransferase|nr:adenine phosphoribosyltransferase [Elusimicrobiota bacterium]
MDLQDKLFSAIRSINDFPVKGIIFRDITPVLKNIALFDEIIDCFADKFKDKKIDTIAGVESRGFLFAMPLAVKMNIPFAPIRKKGKLPAEKVEAAYKLEYGSAVVEMHKDAINPGDRVLIIDDLLATGGTINAATELIEKLKGIPVAAAFVITLEALRAKDGIKNKDLEIFSIIKY